MIFLNHSKIHHIGLILIHPASTSRFLSTLSTHCFPHHSSLIPLTVQRQHTCWTAALGVQRLPLDAFQVIYQPPWPQAQGCPPSFYIHLGLRPRHPRLDGMIFFSPQKLKVLRATVSSDRACQPCIHSDCREFRAAWHHILWNNSGASWSWGTACIARPEILVVELKREQLWIKLKRKQAASVVVTICIIVMEQSDNTCISYASSAANEPPARRNSITKETRRNRDLVFGKAEASERFPLKTQSIMPSYGF